LGQESEPLLHPLEESLPLRFDAIFAPMLAPLQGLLERNIQPKGEIRLQAGGGERLQLADRLQGQAPTMALVGLSGAAIAIGEHPVARFQGWQDPLHHMLGPISSVEEQFSPLPWHLVERGVKQEIAESHAKGRAPGSRVTITVASAGSRPLRGNHSLRA
jgi:hypothetical protein